MSPFSSPVVAPGHGQSRLSKILLTSFPLNNIQPKRTHPAIRFRPLILYPQAKDGTKIMISARQQASNARNAQKSTGPTSSSGRARSAKNATTHGLAGREVLLASEDPAAFDQHIATYRAEQRPRTEHEMYLVTQMAEAAWRLRRVRKFESTILDDAPDPTADEVIDKLLKLNRYATALERSCQRAALELRQIRKARYEVQAASVNAFINSPLPTVPTASGAVREITERTQTPGRIPPSMLFPSANDAESVKK